MNIASLNKIVLPEVKCPSVLKYSFIVKKYNLLLKAYVSTLLLPTVLDKSCQLCSFSNSICKVGMKPAYRKPKTSMNSSDP